MLTYAGVWGRYSAQEVERFLTHADVCRMLTYAGVCGRYSAQEVERFLTLHAIGVARYALYLLYWYKSTITDAILCR